MSGKETSPQDSCTRQKSDIDCKRISEHGDSLNSSTAFEALSDENNKICIIQDSRKQPSKTVRLLQIGKTEAEYRMKHPSCEHIKSNVETQNTTGNNPSRESSTASGINASKTSSSTPVYRLTRSWIDEKSLDSNSDDSSKDSTDESSCVSSTVAESESTWLEKSMQPDADVVREERKIVRRRIRHKYSGKKMTEYRDPCADGEESPIDLAEEEDQSSS